MQLQNLLIIIKLQNNLVVQSLAWLFNHLAMTADA